MMAQGDGGQLFTMLSVTDEDTDTRLHARLVDAAQRDGVLDIAYRTLGTPVGELLLAATEHGLVRVAFPSQNHDQVLSTLAASISPRILRAPKRLDPLCGQIEEYFDHRRTTFDVPLDLRLSKGFRRTVLAHLSDIGYGHTESYAEVAAAAGSPKAARAVGSACATNPVPLVVPCHRAIRSDGSFGDYVGGLDVKHTLLALEAAR